MKIIRIAVISFFVILIYGYSSYALSILASPSSISVPSNVTSHANIRYEIMNTSGCPAGNITSSGGIFTTSTGVNLGSVATHISMSGTAGTTANESLTIPYSVIQQAINYGVNSFNYKRSFTCSAYTTAPPIVTTNVKINIQPSRVSLNINPSPIQFSVPADKTSTQVINYSSLGTVGCSAGSISSSGGSFITDAGRNLGSVPTHIAIARGSAAVTESLTIPYSVIQQAVNHGLRSFNYKRNFTCRALSGASPTAATSVKINIQPSRASLTVTPFPSQFSVAYNRNFTQTISYDFNASVCRNHPSSFEGEFVSDSGVTLGYVNTILTESSKKASETVNIYYGIIKKARNYHLNSFKYKRTFTCSSYSGSTLTGTSYVNINLKSQAGMPLTISRIRLYFKNRKAEITVKQNEPLTAYADLDFMGSGLFKGYWEVDGRVVSPMVFKHLTYGERVTLKTPSIPPIPTFEYGTHFIRFVITQPKPIFDMPKAIYFVETNSKPMRSIALSLPKNSAYIEVKKDTPIQFVWKSSIKDSFYLVEFFGDDDNKPIFSAYSVTLAYAMPPYVIEHYFKKGVKYRWMVKSFSSDSKIIGESDFSSLTIK